MEVPVYEASPQEIEKRFYQLCHAVNSYERLMREKEKAYKNIADFKEEFFNKLVMNCSSINEANGKPRSNADKEREARASQEWQDFNRGLHDAESELLDVKVEYKIRLRNWETCRSLLSSKNIERKTNVR